MVKQDGLFDLRDTLLRTFSDKFDRFVGSSVEFLCDGDKFDESVFELSSTEIDDNYNCIFRPCFIV